MKQSQTNELPETGQAMGSLLEQLQALKKDDYDWQGGRLPHYIWNVDDELFDLQTKAYELYHAENALGAKRAFPSVNRMETDIIDIARSLLGGGADAGGSLTSGGTESILMAMKTARNLSRAKRGAQGKPFNVVATEAAHPAFNKAGEYLAVEVRRVPVDAEFRSDVARMEEQIDDHTIMLVGSAPQYPNGVFDGIADLGRLAERRGLRLHVDACVGGFIAPFARRLGHVLPDFDLSVPGVSSISADLHKYGYCMKGISAVLYKDAADLEYQKFSHDWVRGTYSTDTLPGTRPAGPIAAAWATLHFLGMEGYLRKTREVLDIVAAYARGIEAIDGLTVIRPYDLSIIGYASDSDDVDINAVADFMLEKRWLIGRSMLPRDCIQMAINGVHGRCIDDYLSDLAAAVKAVRSSAAKSKFDTKSY